MLVACFPFSFLSFSIIFFAVIVSDSSTNADTKSVLDDFLDEYMQQIKELGKSRSAFQIMSAKLPEEAEAELPALSNDPSLSSFINSKVCLLQSSVYKKILHCVSLRTLA